jgi:hypothetical protein
MTPQPPTRGLRSRANLIWLVAYAAMLTAIVAAMLQGRQSTLEAFDTPEARAQWQAWREAEPNTSEQGPVQRRPPSTTEPPALVLMRDYFGVMLSGALLFSSLLFGAIMVAARGAFSATVPTGSPSKPLSPGGRG